MISQFLEEEQVNMVAAVLAVIFVVISIILGVAGGFMFAVGDLTGALASWGVVALFGLIGLILQAIVLYQWSAVINQNLSNTQQMFLYLKERIEDPLRGEIGFFANRMEEFTIPTWPYWVYLAMYIISLFTGWYALLFNLLGFIFLAFYINNIFKSTSKVSNLKNKVYHYLKEEKGVSLSGEVYRIPSRNIITFIILSVITLSIYWLYLLVKLSSEINNYVKSDEKMRKEIEEVFRAAAQA